MGRAGFEDGDLQPVRIENDGLSGDDQGRHFPRDMQLDRAIDARIEGAVRVLKWRLALFYLSGNPDISPVSVPPVFFWNRA